jgi:hypothetical protein
MKYLLKNISLPLLFFQAGAAEVRKGVASDGVTAYEDVKTFGNSAGSEVTATGMSLSSSKCHRGNETIQKLCLPMELFGRDLMFIGGGLSQAAIYMPLPLDKCLALIYIRGSDR